MEAIKKSTLEFLNNLKNNNNRDWFLQNKSDYLAARGDFELFVQELINKIIEFEPLMKGLEARSCIYRINRDIRFTNDKSPYKTHFGAFIVRGGKQNGDKYPGYYFHIEAGNKSIIAGGAYIPPAPWLSAIREKISEEGDRLVKIIRDKEFISTFGKLEGESLKTAPKGYPKDHPHIGLLRMKSFLVERVIPDKVLLTDECFGIVARAARTMKPLNDFLDNH
jgi:uncharacterized protein (TIGR02453 family)